MSTFDNRFDPKLRLNRWGCSCGQHRSQVEHDAEAQRRLRCASIESEQARYQGVVASAVMRAVFPRESARRAFLKAVGASTALAALSQLFPLKAATEAFADTGTIEKKDLKVGCSGRDARFIARPPHRTVRAAFPHTAPTSGV